MWWLVEDALAEEFEAAAAVHHALDTLEPMYMAFDDGRPWVSAFRADFGPDAPSVQRRICTRFKPPGAQSDGDLPSYPGYPVAMFLRIFAAAPLMLLSRPVGVLP